MTRLSAATALLAFAPFLLAAGPAPTPAPAMKAKAHGVALAGRVTKVDAARRTLAVRDASGKEVALSWTAATKIAGGELKTGDSVTVRYLDKDAKHIATYIRVNTPAGTTPTPAAAPAAATPGA